MNTSHQAIITLNLKRTMTEDEIWDRLERLGQYYPACQVCRVICESCANCVDPEDERGPFDVCAVSVSKDVVEGEDLYDAGRFLAAETVKYFEGSTVECVELRTISVGDADGPENIGWVVV